MSPRPPWWPTATDKAHANAGCAHPDTCRVELERGLSVVCQECGARHEATYSHEGHYGEGPIYAVLCPDDGGLTDYYTAEVLWRTCTMCAEPAELGEVVAHEGRNVWACMACCVALGVLS